MAYFRAVPLDAQPWLSDEPSGAVGGVDEHGRPYCTVHGPMAGDVLVRRAKQEWLCLDPTCGVAARVEFIIEEGWLPGRP